MAHKMKFCSTLLLMTLVVLSVVHLTRQASVSLQFNYSIHIPKKSSIVPSRALSCLKDKVRRKTEVLSRAERSSSNYTQEKKCETNSPCGWAIYSTTTRHIEKFEKNTCDCPKPLLCIRMEDDITTGTYVYRCREASNGIAS